jgi:hypothetical protein
MKNNKPDYIFWSKLEFWKLKDAALLLHDIEPHLYKTLKFLTKDVPADLTEVYKTYLILKDAQWKDYPSVCYGNEANPYTIIAVAIRKELPLPQELHDLVNTRYQRERELKCKSDFSNENKCKDVIILNNNTNLSKNTPITIRERNNLLKAIGILVKILINDKANTKLFRNGQKPSAYQISQLIIEKAEMLNIETDGLKSFNRKITEALGLLNEELPINS